MSPARRNGIPIGESGRVGDGKSLAHLQAEELAQKRFIELMASGGVGYNQMAKEVLFFLPRAFLDAYEQLWYKGLGGKDDGGSNARGASASETAAVGKARVAGGSSGDKAGPGGSQRGRGAREGKRYKKYWVIADEEALHIKDRVDKRLRGLAREITDDLKGLEEVARLAAVDGEVNTGANSSVVGAAHCTGCGRLARSDWRFCPFDGEQLG